MNPRRELSLFSLIISVDYILGFIPLLPILIGWLLVPMVWLLCGKRYVIWWYLISMAESMPTLLGYTITLGQSAASIAQAKQQNIPPPFIPYLTPLWISINSFLASYGYWPDRFFHAFNDLLSRLVTAPLWLIKTYIPIWAQNYLDFAYVLMILFGLIYMWYRMNIIGAKTWLIRHAPFLESWGIFNPKDYEAIREELDRRQRWELRRRMKKAKTYVRGQKHLEKVLPLSI